MKRATSLAIDLYSCDGAGKATGSAETGVTDAKAYLPERKPPMKRFERDVPTIIYRAVTRTIILHLMTASIVQEVLMQLAADSWDAEAGQFTSSPWEGLSWKADPPTEESCDHGVILDESLGRFLLNLMYGE